MHVLHECYLAGCDEREQTCTVAMTCMYSWRTFSAVKFSLFVIAEDTARADEINVFARYEDNPSYYLYMLTLPELGCGTSIIYGSSRSVIIVKRILLTKLGEAYSGANVTFKINSA